MAFRSPLYSNPIRNGAYFSPSRPSPPSSKPKVVSIPVHFVGSDDKKSTDPSPATRSAAAIKVQKAVRGFLVRKNIKIVRKIEAEVEEIEMKLKKEEEMDLIVRDEKERLKINEMLMALLLRLDSVRGVRDYRKRVIRKVITMQEAVDSIPAARSADQTLDTAADSTETPQVTDPDEVKTPETGDLVIEEAKTLEVSDQSSPQDDEPADVRDFAAENQESAVEEEEEEEDEALESEKNKRGEMMMERMVAENEKLKGLVAELCQRSAQQCRLMGGIAERVEHLEKIVEKMERRKKKKRKDI